MKSINLFRETGVNEGSGGPLPTDNTIPQSEDKVIYPTAPDADGWFTSSATAEESGLETKNFATGGYMTRIDGEEQYPSVAGPDGYFYENAGMFALNIEKRVDAETDDITMRVKLSGGRTAVVRELTGKENKTAAKIAGITNSKNQNANQDKMMNAMIFLSTTITDKDGNKVKFVAEDLDSWKGKDMNRLNTANNLLNF